MQINDKEVVENILYAYKRNRKVVIKSKLPFKSFMRLFDKVVDSGYKKIQEINIREFAYYVNETKEECYHYEVDKHSFEDFLKIF